MESPDLGAWLEKDSYASSRKNQHKVLTTGPPGKFQRAGWDFKQAPGITEPDQWLSCFTKFRSPNSQRKAGSYGCETQESESVSYPAVSSSLQPHGCSPPGSSVHGILQARILEWVALPFSRGSSWPRDRTRVFCIAGGFFTTVPPGKPWKPRGMFLLLWRRRREY